MIKIIYTGTTTLDRINNDYQLLTVEVIENIQKSLEEHTKVMCDIDFRFNNHLPDETVIFSMTINVIPDEYIDQQNG